MDHRDTQRHTFGIKRCTVFQLHATRLAVHVTSSVTLHTQSVVSRQLPDVTNTHFRVKVFGSKCRQNSHLKERTREPDAFPGVRANAEAEHEQAINARDFQDYRNMKHQIAPAT